MKVRLVGTLGSLFLAGWAAAQEPGRDVPAPSATNLIVPNPAVVQPVQFTGNMPAPAAAPSFAAAPAGPAFIVPETTVSSGPIVYSDAEFLLWRVRSGRIPSTATTAAVGVLTVDTSDIYVPDIGLPGSTGYAPVSILSTGTFGAGASTDYGAQAGGRFTLGAWADEDKTWGVEGNFLFLERGSDRFTGTPGASANQLLIDTGFTRTLFLVQAGTPVEQGTFQVLVTRQVDTALFGQAASTLYGGELHARSVGLRIGGFDFGGLAGFRFLNFNDELAIRNTTRFTQPAGVPPSNGDLTTSLSGDFSTSSNERVRTQNFFYGAQVGVDCDAKFGAFFVNTRFKAAVGNMHQVARVEGQTVLVNNDPVRTLANGQTFATSPLSSTNGGGLLSSPNGQGRYERDVISVIPELNVKVGYQVTTWLRAHVGYDGLYLNRVARAGSVTATDTLTTNVQIGSGNETVNVAQPVFRFRDQDVWVQGVSFGLECRY